MYRFALLVPFALSACQLAPIAESRPVPLSSAMVQEIKSEVTHDFFDPGSAQFRNIRAADVTLADGSQERRVCGEVNGKNRLGGYVGFTWFGGNIVSGDFQRRDFSGPCEPW